MTKTAGWGRPWAIAKSRTDSRLRTGAWYPVISHESPSEVVLVVQHREVTVPVNLVELRKGRPGRFTVVHRPDQARNPARGTKRNLGRHYAVCPASGHRLPLEGEPSHMECPRCGYQGEVAWHETG